MNDKIKEYEKQLEIAKDKKDQLNIGIFKELIRDELTKTVK